VPSSKSLPTQRNSANESSVITTADATPISDANNSNVQTAGDLILAQSQLPPGSGTAATRLASTANAQQRFVGATTAASETTLATATMPTEAIKSDTTADVRAARSAKDSTEATSAVNVAITAAAASAATAIGAAENSTAGSSASAKFGRNQSQNATPAIDAASPKPTASPVPQPPGILPTPSAGPAQQTGSQAAGQLAAVSGAGAGEVDRVRFLQRVAGAFRAADEQGGQIRLRLSPPELGSMKLELSVRDGLMTAHVQAETDTARNLLLDHLPQLRERLADHNIKIDHFDVELMNQSKSGTPQNFSGGRDPGLALVQQNARRTSSAVAPAAASVASAPVRGADRRLDVTV
jgi:flagellar hook-length control protein FliK